MESLASVVEPVLARLPTFGPFLGLAGGSAAFVAFLFLGRRFPILRGLREHADRLLGWTVAVLLLAMVFLSSLQIILRNFFDSGFLWIDPLLRHLVLLLAFAGALIATSVKRHVQINVLGRLFKGAAARFVGAVVAALSAFICLALTHAGLLLVRDEVEYSEMAFLDVPSWAVASVFPVAFFALAFRFLLLFFEELVGEAPQPQEGTFEGLELEEETSS